MELGEPKKVSKSQLEQWEDLFKTLPRNTKLFDDLSDSPSSELSELFSDVVLDPKVESKRKAKELYGKDLYTAFSFSPEFKTAIEEIKKETKENPKQTVTVESSEVKPQQLTEEQEIELIQLPGIDFEVEEEEIEERKKDKEDDKKKKLWLEEDESVFDTMSGYWRLLSVFDEFRISPPWYDAFAGGKEHWLSTKPIPFDVLENSRKKCMNWLSKYFDK